MPNPPPKKPEEKQSSAGSKSDSSGRGDTASTATGGRYRLKFYLASVVAVAFAGLLGWQLIRSAALRDDLVAEQAALVQSHARQLDSQARQLLHTSGQLLQWVVEKPLAEERLRDIEPLIKELLDQASIALVAVADRNLRIQLATNHKLEGQTLQAAFPKLGGGGGDIAIVESGTGLLVAVPVLINGQELGRAVISYEPSLDDSAATAGN